MDGLEESNGCGRLKKERNREKSESEEDRSRAWRDGWKSEKRERKRSSDGWKGATERARRRGSCRQLGLEKEKPPERELELVATTEKEPAATIVAESFIRNGTVSLSFALSYQ